MMLSLTCKLLDQAQNIGQIAQIGQSQAHQQEQIRWVRRSHRLQAQSLRLDALDHAKEEIRSHYDTYAGRLDTLLLALALIWPFALNTIQFSDRFVPDNEIECPDCVQGEHPWLIGVWVMLVGTVLILPFWGILMLIRCKLKLDWWLEQCLKDLNRERRAFVIGLPPPAMPESSLVATLRKTLSSPRLGRRDKKLEEREDAEETETTHFVLHVLGTVLGYQEKLSKIWISECGWLVHTATMLLWMSAVAALLLTSTSMWILLVNTGGAHAYYSKYFAALILGGGCAAPAVYIGRQKYFDREDDDIGGSHGCGLCSDPVTAHARRTSLSSISHSSSIADLDGSRAGSPARAPTPGRFASCSLPATFSLVEEGNNCHPHV